MARFLSRLCVEVREMQWVDDDDDFMKQLFWELKVKVTQTILPKKDIIHA